MSKISKETKQKAVAYYKDCRSTTKTAQRFNISNKTVLNWAKQAGIPVLTRSRAKSNSAPASKFAPSATYKTKFKKEQLISEALRTELKASETKLESIQKFSEYQKRALKHSEEEIELLEIELRVAAQINKQAKAKFEKLENEKRIFLQILDKISK